MGRPTGIRAKGAAGTLHPCLEYPFDTIIPRFVSLLKEGASGNIYPPPIAQNYASIRYPPSKLFGMMLIRADTNIIIIIIIIIMEGSYKAHNLQKELKAHKQ